MGYFLDDIDEERLGDFSLSIQNQVTSGSVKINQFTTELKIGYEETKIFKFHIEASNVKNIQVLVEIISGEIKIESLFDSENGRYDLGGIQRLIGVKHQTLIEKYSNISSSINQSKTSSESILLDVPIYSKNLYLTINGIDEFNVFKMNVTSFKSNISNSAFNSFRLNKLKLKEFFALFFISINFF
jgi:hypothetical protein